MNWAWAVLGPAQIFTKTTRRFYDIKKMLDWAGLYMAQPKSSLKNDVSLFEEDDGVGQFVTT